MNSELSNENGSWNVFKNGLKKTRKGLLEGLGDLVLGKKEIDAEVFETLEAALLRADVGVRTTKDILEELTEKIERQRLSSYQDLLGKLVEVLTERLKPLQGVLGLNGAGTQVVIFVGVNGAGKTTTIGKMADLLSKESKKVLLAAGDTYRAAAIEQLGQWAKKNEISVVAQSRGSDSASVAYDAFESARAKRSDILMIDTAGRLQANTQLMDELTKMMRVLSKIDSTAPHEVILVLDSSTGQNAISQVKVFDDAIGLTGLVLTKLDGSAKAGFLFPLAKHLIEVGRSPLPIYYVGLGEGITDLLPFEAEPFVKGLIEADE